MNLFQKYLVDEFVEDYQEHRLSRREAMKMIATIVGSTVVANSILAACAPLDPQGVSTAPAPSAPTSAPAMAATPENAELMPTASPTDVPQASPTAAAESTATRQPENTQSVQPAGAPHGTVTANDLAVIAGAVTFPGQDAEIMGYLARPAGGEPAPVILVCHENRGLTPHIQDVARRLAKAGYVALAVDLLSRNGGSPSLESSDVPGILGNMAADTFVQDFLSGWRWLADQAFSLTERVCMMGFCFGGGVTWQVATHMPELKAAAPFYGPHPELGDVPNIQAAVQAVYGGLDARINAGIPAIEAAMQENGKIYKKLIYPDADHAFFNDSGTRYNPAAAEDAWKQTLNWFGEYV